MRESTVFRLQNTIRIGGLVGLQNGSIGAGQSVHRNGSGQWELVFLRGGEAEIIADNCSHLLQAGQLVIHRPREAYSLIARGPDGAHMSFVAFVCNSPAMRKLRGRSFTLTPAQQRLAARLAAECSLAFGPLQGLDDQAPLMPRRDAPRGSQQLVGLYLTQLLLELLQRPYLAPSQNLPVAMDESFLPLYCRTRELMCATLDGSLRFTQVCRAVGLSATVFKERFQRHTGLTVMDFYRRLRIEEARKRLRKGDRNIAQVADELGYSSAAAFSRQFRQVMRITPSDYLRSVRSQNTVTQPARTLQPQQLFSPSDRNDG